MRPPSFASSFHACSLLDPWRGHSPFEDCLTPPSSSSSSSFLLLWSSQFHRNHNHQRDHRRPYLLEDGLREHVAQKHGCEGFLVGQQGCQCRRWNLMHRLALLVLVMRHTYTLWWDAHFCITTCCDAVCSILMHRLALHGFCITTCSDAVSSIVMHILALQGFSVPPHVHFVLGCTFLYYNMLWCRE